MLRLYILFSLFIIVFYSHAYALKQISEQDDAISNFSDQRQDDALLQAFGSANGALIAPRLYISAISRKPGKKGYIHFYNKEGEIIESGKIRFAVDLQKATNDPWAIKDYQNFKSRYVGLYNYRNNNNLALYIFEKPIKKVKPVKLFRLSKLDLINVDKYLEDPETKLSRTLLEPSFETFVAPIFSDVGKVLHRKKLALRFPGTDEIDPDYKKLEFVTPLVMENEFKKMPSILNVKLRDSNKFRLEARDSGAPVLALNEEGEYGLFALLGFDSTRTKDDKEFDQNSKVREKADIFFLSELPQIDRWIEHFKYDEKVKGSEIKGFKIKNYMEAENFLQPHENLIVLGKKYNPGLYELDLSDSFGFYAKLMDPMLNGDAIDMRIRDGKLVIRNPGLAKLNITFMSESDEYEQTKTFETSNQKKDTATLSPDDFVKNPHTLKLTIEHGAEKRVFDLSDSYLDVFGKWLKKAPLKASKKQVKKKPTRLKADDDD